MALFIDRKFITLLAPKLDKFVQKNDYIWNFRCPYCGDSRKNKVKARGYVYRKKNDLFFMCHNCGTSTSFGKFLKAIDPLLYKEYQLERYKNDSHSNVKLPDFSLAKEKPLFNTSINLPSIDSLPDNHPAKLFVTKRRIPKEKNKNIFYAQDFAAFIDEILPNNGKKLYKNDERIVIPFYDEKNILQGVQGRTISNSQIRYITIIINEEVKKVYGLNTIDFTKKIYVVEGPIDSFFLQNSIAMMDASLYRATALVGQYDYVFVYDNEPRNKDIVKHMKKTIDLGHNICIWPKDLKEKDINDMILSNHSPSEIQNIIDKNIYSDLRAKLEFENWKKV
jgi:hypothetical protein